MARARKASHGSATIDRCCWVSITWSSLSATLTRPPTSLSGGLGWRRQAAADIPRWGRRTGWHGSAIRTSSLSRSPTVPSPKDHGSASRRSRCSNPAVASRPGQSRQTPIDADVAALRSNGARLGDSTAGERERPDGTIVRWRLAIGESLGPAKPPFLIEHDPASAEWTTEDRAARAAQNHSGWGTGAARVLELPFPDVPAAVNMLGRAADLRFRPSLTGGSARDANLGRQVVRLRAAHGAPGRPVISLASPAGDDRSVDLLGCRWSVRRSG